MSRAIIVVPCYNEAQRLDGARFLEFARTHPELSFLMVDDGSRDGTLGVLRRLQQAAGGSVDVYCLPQNQGKSEAVRQGILRALAEQPDYVGFWDADLATPLEPICGFCRVLDERPEIELVFGTRIALLGRRIQRRPLRRLLGRTFAAVASGLLRLPLYDTQCGAKLFRVSPAIGQLFARPFVAKWVFDVEILGRLVQARRGSHLPPVHRILYEYPLEQWRDVAGSKLKPHDFAWALLDLASIYWRYLRPGLSRPSAEVLGETPASSPVATSQPAPPRRAA